jgi:hypothetical protein
MADLSVPSPLKKLNLGTCSRAISKAQAVVQSDMRKVTRAINKEGIGSGVFAKITNGSSKTQAPQLKIFASKYGASRTSLRYLLRSVSSVEQLLDPKNKFIELVRATKVLEMHLATVKELNKKSKRLFAIHRELGRLTE